MARKPLLSGPVLNREDVQSRLSGDDIMSRVIENDAAKHGRTPSPTPTSQTGRSVNKLINQQANKQTTQQTDTLTNNLMDGQANGLTDELVNPSVNNPVATAPTPPAGDAITAAYLAALSQPYPTSDPRADKSPRVLVAGRVRPEVSERFETACTLLKKKGDKQDVLDKALQLFIEHVVAHGGDIDL